jgi:hypothetical protein
MRSITADLGLSDIAVRKVAIRTELPIPPQGHWNKILAGKNTTPKPRLPPRGFGEPDEVQFGAEDWSLSPSKFPEDKPLPTQPVFEETMESVRDRAAKAVGKVAVSRDLKVTHPAVRRLLDDDVVRAEKARATPFLTSYYAPRFSTPLDYRKLRLLSAIALGLARAKVKAATWKVGEAAIDIGAGHGFPLSITKPSGRGVKDDDNNRLAIIVGASPDGHGRVLAQWHDKNDLI